MIATAYLLNQKPSERKFKNYEQYQALRDDFIFALARVHGGAVAIGRRGRLRGWFALAWQCCCTRRCCSVLRLAQPRGAAPCCG